MNPPHNEAAIMKAAEGLASGRPRSSVVSDFVADGWIEADANELVMSVESAMLKNASEGSQGGSNVGGWLFWIGALALFNLLSWAFDWPFWLY